MSEQEQEQAPVEEEQATPEETPPPVAPDEDEEAEQHESEAVEGHEREGEEPSLEAQRREQVAAAKRINTAKSTYAKRLIEILGDEFSGLLVCPRCSHDELPFGGIPGFIVPPQFAPVSADMKAEVMESVGEQPATATMQTKYARRCDACDGNGVVLTGSRTNRDKAINCPECKGRGWLPVGDELRVGRSDIAPAPAENGQAGVGVETLAPSEPAPDVDLWGRKVGDPDYGVHPLYARTS